MFEKGDAEAQRRGILMNDENNGRCSVRNGVVCAWVGVCVCVIT